MFASPSTGISTAPPLSDALAFTSREQLIYGLSYGGLNCLQALAREPAAYVAGACSAPVFNHVTSSDGPLRLSPPTDGAWRQYATGPEPDLSGPAWPAAVGENVALAWASSPASLAANISAPLLLLHGDADANVAFQESVAVVRALRSQNGSAAAALEAFVLPDETHGFALFEHQLLAAEPPRRLLTSSRASLGASARGSAVEEITPD